MAKKKTEKKIDDTLQMVIDDFKSAWDYTSTSWQERWEDNYKLFNNVRVKKAYKGTTNTFVPMVYSTVETMNAALFGMKPKFAYLPPSNKQDQKTDILNGMVNYYWDKDQWSIKVINTGRNLFNLGTAIDYFMWDIDHPKMINIPLRDFFIDPLATSLENARYCGRRYLCTLDELKSFEIIDPEDKSEDPKLIKRFKNLDSIEAGSDAPEKTDKEEKDILYGSTLSKPENKQVEVIEYWTLEKTITVVNREVVAEDTKNWFLQRAETLDIKNPKGMLPFADAHYVTDPSLFYSKGLTDFIADQQELLNDITNQNIDSISFILNQMYTLDPTFADLINQIENIPGAIYPFPKGALEPINQRSVPPEAFNERMNIKNEIRETTASNEVVKGVGQQNSGTTATEINAQVAGAGQRMNMIVTQVENGYFHRMAMIVFNMIRLYVTEPMMIRILGKDGARWEEFDPSEYRDGDYEPMVQLDISVQNQKTQQGNQVKELMAMFLNDPDVNQQELKKMVLQRSFDLDPDEVGQLMQVAPQMPQSSIGAPMEAPTEQPLPVKQMTDEELLAYIEANGGMNGQQTPTPVV